MNHKNFKNSYEQYLRENYSFPDRCKMLIKQGYIMKENEIPNRMELTQRGRLLETQFRIYKLIYDEVKDEILRIYSIIEQAKEDIEILKIQNSSYELNEILLQTEIETIAENMFSKLSASVQKITLKTYKKAFETLTLEWSEILGNESNLTDDSLIENELFDKINAWIVNLKTWLFDSINSVFDDSLLEEKNFIQKGVFDGFFENVKEIFVKLKDGTETLIRNAILDAQTAAQKISFKIQRVESYEIILSGNPNACNHCQEMDGVHFNIADLKIGETAPPFHPNCGCGMIPKVYAKKTGSDWEKIVIAFNVAFEFLAHIGPTEKLFPPFYNFIKSSIWLAGDTYLGIMKKLPLAREMFRLGMYGEGKGMSEKAIELIIKTMKNSKKLNDKIFKLTESGEDFDTGDDGFEFKKETDEDLYYAVQNVNMRIIGTNLGENKWKIKVISWDDYDFTQFRNSLAFADLANNLGEAMQRNGMMTPYNTLTEYEFIWQRK